MRCGATAGTARTAASSARGERYESQLASGMLQAMFHFCLFTAALPRRLLPRLSQLPTSPPLSLILYTEYSLTRTQRTCSLSPSHARLSLRLPLSARFPALARLSTPPWALTSLGSAMHPARRRSPPHPTSTSRPSSTPPALARSPRCSTPLSPPSQPSSRSSCPLPLPPPASHCHLPCAASTAPYCCLPTWSSHTGWTPH